MPKVEYIFWLVSEISGRGLGIHTYRHSSHCVNNLKLYHLK